MGLIIAGKVPVEILPDGRMTAAHAARYVGCSPKTLAHRRCDGTGPRFIRRGRIYYFKEDLDDWLGLHGRHSSTAQARSRSVLKQNLEVNHGTH